jgi:hypothetical protein
VVVCTGTAMPKVLDRDGFDVAQCMKVSQCTLHVEGAFPLLFFLLHVQSEGNGHGKISLRFMGFFRAPRLGFLGLHSLTLCTL